MRAADGWNRDSVRRLRAIRSERETGRLEARADSALREIFVRDGRIVGIRTSVETERLGELLMRVGRITRQHFEDASIFVRKGIRIGQILAELRIIDPSEIDEMLHRQATEVASAVVIDPDVEITFERTSELFTTLDVAMSVSDVIIAAARRVESPSRALEALGLRSVLRPVDSSELVGCTALTPEDAYLLSRFQDGSTIDGALSAAGIAEDQALRSVLGLVESGMLEVEKDQPEARDPMRDEVHRMFELLREKDPWRALGLPGDVGIETARAAFRDAVRKFHPDRYQAVSDPVFQRELASVCESFTNAFTCLTTALKLRGAAPQDGAIALASTTVERQVPTETRSAAAAPAAPARAEASVPWDPHVFFKEARRAMESRDYWRAVELLRVLVERRDDHAPYHFLLAEALSKNPRWRHEAETSYQRAIELDPYRIEFYDGLAKLYESAGLLHRAEGVHHRAEEMGVVATGAA